MNPPALRQVNSSLFAEAKQATKQLYSSDTRCRYAMEIGAMGFALMLGLSLFGGAPNSSNGSSSAPSNSYNPQSSSSPSSSTATSPTGQPPSISQAQLNAIKSQTGGGTIVNTVPIAPIVVKPVLTEDEAKIEHSTTDPSDPYTYTGKKSGPRPAYQENNKK